MPIKVLIIDDDSSMTELLSTFLHQHAMEVYSSSSGNQGIEMARTVCPDIVIVDLLLPGTDGWEVCKILRSFTKAPIAILSALDDPKIITSALDAGADDYMTKPVPNTVLLAHINNLTRRYAVESHLSNSLINNDLKNCPPSPTNLH